MRRDRPYKQTIARIKFLRAVAIVILMIGLCVATLYNDFRMLTLNQKNEQLVLENIISQVNNQTILALTNFSDFIDQAPKPTQAEKNRFSELVSKQLPYLYTLNIASAYDRRQLADKVSANFVLKQTNQFPDGHNGLKPYTIQDFNFIVDYVFPLNPKTKPIIGLDVFPLNILQSLFTQQKDTEFDRLLEAPNQLQKTVTDAFALFEGGYAISLNQAVGEVAFQGEVFPAHITSLLIELDIFRDYLAQLANINDLRIGVAKIDQEQIWFGKPLANELWATQITDVQEVLLYGRKITIETSFNFGIQQISWQLMSALFVLAIACIIFFNKLYTVIERKQAKLVAVNNKLTHNLKTQSDMLAYISHQLNTPLTLISLANQQLQKQKDKTSDTLFHLDTIRQQTHKMTNLVQHILEVKTTERLSLDPQQHELIAHLKHMIADYEAGFREKHITLRVDCSGLERFDVTYDQISMELVVDNLLSNALKYTDQYEWVDIKLGYHPTRSAALELVIMNGHDVLNDAECENIFTRFVRLNAETIDGSGLGLGVVKEVCERNNWDIICYSAVKSDVSLKFGKDAFVAFSVTTPV